MSTSCFFISPFASVCVLQEVVVPVEATATSLCTMFRRLFPGGGGQQVVVISHRMGGGLYPPQGQMRAAGGGVLTPQEAKCAAIARGGGLLVRVLFGVIVFIICSRRVTGSEASTSGPHRGLT
jgi:hypothetical protein